MSKENALAVFENYKIRRIYDEQKEGWYFSIIDVVGALTDSVNPRDYWFKMKIRVKTEDGLELSTICRQFKMKAPDGKMRETDCADVQGLLRIIQSTEDADKKKPFVCFGSFQDYLGKNKSTGGIKTKNEWVHEMNWDCVILDEYHYGAWRENAKELFEAEDKKEAEFGEGEGIEDFDEAIMPITTNAYLYLSGTPFRAIASGEFIEEQVFNWTYSDEQRAKQEWQGGNNPYASLPRMVLMTYQLPDAIREIAMQGEFNEFDLNLFFTADGTGEQAKFKYQDEVQKWLDLIRGTFQATTVDNLKLGAKRPPFPFSDVRLLNLLAHTFWFLPSVASCHAMRNLLKQKQNLS